MQDAPHTQESPPSHRPYQKTRRTADQWYELISEYQTSGLTQRDYCEQHDVPYSSFTNWFAKFKKDKPALSTQKTQSPLFVEMTTPTPVQTTPSLDWDVELSFSNGMMLRIKQR